jgi:hypothetical protein
MIIICFYACFFIFLTVCMNSLCSVQRSYVTRMINHARFVKNPKQLLNGNFFADLLADVSHFSEICFKGVRIT